MPRRKINLNKVLANMNKACPSCGHSISPAEVKRVDFDWMQCPRCRGVFVADKARR